MRILAMTFTVTACAMGAVSAASAQREQTEQGRGFLELAGDFGFQFGEQEYVPTGVPGESEHPLTTGLGFNATGGIRLTGGLDLVLDYAYGSAESRVGQVTGVLTSVQGSIDYHAITTGLRTGRALGPGRLYGELAVGVILPFETRLQYEYGELMNQLGISGEGERVENYNLGVGAHGEAGYQLALGYGVYLGSALRIQGFQSNNDGESTEYDNFVLDFMAPQAMTMEIDHGTERAATPSTYSVQDLRLHVDLGYRF